MATKPAARTTIENAQVSRDGKTLFLNLHHHDPAVIAFAKSGGLGDDPVEAAKRLFTIGVLSVATGSAQATISELYQVIAHLDAMSAMPQLAAEQTRQDHRSRTGPCDRRRRTPRRARGRDRRRD